MVKVESNAIAHVSGQTYATYTPDGKYLITCGANPILRRFETGSTDEPLVIDDCSENGISIVATDKTIVVGSLDGTVNLLSPQSSSLEQLLVRSSLPVRDVALTRDGAWVAVASDESVVKVVNTSDNQQILTLREQSSGNKYVAFHPHGSHLAVSCTDGVVYVYSLSTQEPQLVTKVDGVIKAVDAESEACTKVAWTPDGRAFAAPTATRDILVVARDGWGRQRSFENGHSEDIVDFAWSPNGAFLLSASADGKAVLWESKTQKILQTYSFPKITCLVWHPKDNAIAYCDNDGWVRWVSGIVPDTHLEDFRKSIQLAPLLHAPAATTTAEIRTRDRRERSLSRDSADDLFDVGLDDDFIEDDDGAGYVEKNVNGKRPGEFLVSDGVKRPSYGSLWAPKTHPSLQPCSTPWRLGRRYLCLNTVGFVWTVDQETHHTVTTEFHDRSTYRGFHFTDPFRYDKACLNEHGTLFSNQPADGNPATLYYRPHESWTSRVEWRINLPAGEDIAAIALGENFVVVSTGNGYVRVYTLYGVPFRVYRQKHMPVVSCASYRDYVLTLGNGPVGADGRATLLYSLENVRRDETLQSNDVVALPPGAEVRGVFFSDEGDPMVYDSEGVLLVLLHWREMGQGRWVPLLDTKTLDRLAGGGKEESYWPVAVTQDRFHCIILKGGEKHPYFPRPLLSDFPFKIPLSKPSTTTSATTDEEALEETYVRESILLSLQQDSAGSRVVDASERAAMAKRENSIDKALLQLLVMECKEEDHGAKALEICGLFRQRRTLDLAIRVAEKYQRTVLVGKIAELREGMEVEVD